MSEPAEEEGKELCMGLAPVQSKLLAWRLFCCDGGKHCGVFCCVFFFPFFNLCGYMSLNLKTSSSISLCNFKTLTLSYCLAGRNDRDRKSTEELVQLRWAGRMHVCIHGQGEVLCRFSCTWAINLPADRQSR